MSRPVVLVAEELAPSALAVLSGDFEVRTVDGADRAALLPALKGVDAVIVRTMPPGSLEQVVFRMNLLARLESAGFGVDRVPVDAQGLADATGMAGTFREDTRFATLMLANNETGAIQPVGALAPAADFSCASFSSSSFVGSLS